MWSIVGWERGEKDENEMSFARKQKPKWTINSIRMNGENKVLTFWSSPFSEWRAIQSVAPFVSDRLPARLNDRKNFAQCKP
jgi:hypothetical protein